MSLTRNLTCHAAVEMTCPVVQFMLVSYIVIQLVLVESCVIEKLAICFLKYNLISYCCFMVLFLQDSAEMFGSEPWVVSLNVSVSGQFSQYCFSSSFTEKLYLKVAFVENCESSRSWNVPFCDWQWGVLVSKLKSTFISKNAES